MPNEGNRPRRPAKGGGSHPGLEPLKYCHLQVGFPLLEAQAQKALTNVNRRYDGGPSDRISEP